MKTTLLSILAIAALAAIPQFVESPYLVGLGFTVLLGIATASAWNIIGGYAGQYSFGHAAYFGAGAYTTLVLLTQYQVNPILGSLAGIGISLVLAGITGGIVFRLKGHYFALASIAVAEIIRLCVLNLPSITNGAEGVNAADELSKFTVGFADLTSKVPFYYMALILVVITIVTSWMIQRGKLGYCLQAIREDQDAASSLGISLPFYKNSALLISAGFTSVAGSIYGCYIRFIDVGSTLTLDMSIEMILISIIGGVGTVFGPALGALVLIPVAELLRSNVIAQVLIDYGVIDDGSPLGLFFKENLAHAHVLIYGIITVVVILCMPNGIIGAVSKRFGRKS